MQPVFAHALRYAFAAAALAGAVACAPAQRAPTVSAAEITSGPVAESTPAASAPAETSPSEPAAAPTPTSEAPSAQLACRTKSATLGTSELLLDWQGGAAKGTLHRTAPSGNVTDVAVRAERYNGMIVADDVHQTDLVVHAAVVTEKDGKKYMRLGDANQTWLACE